MQKSCLLAATAALVLTMQTSLALAQGAPAAGGTTAPAATSAPAATGAGTDEAAQPAGRKSASKKPAKKKMTRQQEIDRSVETGTVPARYRSSVPKQYHQYIPFSKQ